MPRNLQELPRFADKMSYLYVERAVIEQDKKAIAFHDAEGTTTVPAAALAMLILGPGTKITHAAVRSLADNNCQIVWSGEHGVRFYAHGLGGSRSSRNLIRQAALTSDELSRLQVVIRMYCLRFDDQPAADITLQQLRGKEGIRMRQAYAETAERFGVDWQGRSYDRGQWNYADPLNRALSAANSCLYGLVHAAIVSGGYSPALGFIHTGKQLSFVYDIADLYKTEITIPLAFGVVALGATEIERETRIACRDTFRQAKLMERILPDIARVMDVPTAARESDEFAVDAARPSELWNPRTISNDMPIGRVLKLASLNLNELTKGDDDDRADRGENYSFPTG
jgi:CRISPR-associated protein Cas1